MSTYFRRSRFYWYNGVENPAQIQVFGLDIEIANGDNTPSVEDGTDFASIIEGQPLTHTFTIQNNGGETLSITTPITVPTGFTCTLEPANTVLAGASTTFEIQADAEGVDIFSGNVSIANSTDDNNPFVFAITVNVISTLNDGVLVYYQMEEESGNRVNALGASLALTDNNTVTRNTGKINFAAEFVGANSEYLSVADNAALRGLDVDWSWDFWVYVTVPSTAQIIFSKGTGTVASTRDYLCFISSSNIQIRASNGTAEATKAFTGLTVLANTFYHVYVEHDSIANLLGISVNNGTLQTVAFTANNSHLPGGDFRVGVNCDLSGALTGRIDELVRWGRKLTTTERTNRYNAGAGMGYPFTA